MSALSLSDYQDQILTSYCATLDYIPLISNISGAVRAVFGSLQTAVGIILLPMEFVSHLSGDQDCYIADLGATNVARGLIASIPIIGNAVLYTYDHDLQIKYIYQKKIGIIR